MSSKPFSSLIRAPSRIAVAAMSIWIAGAAHAGTGWVEAVSGDLSNDGLNPTLVTVLPGSNFVSGTAGNGGAGIDRDFLRFTVPANAEITSLRILPGTFVSGSVSFIGMQIGPTVTPGGSGLFGFFLYAPEDVDTNILGNFLAPGQTSLASGDYSVWIQDTGGTVSYGFDFMLTSAVPEPSAAVLLALGLAGLVAPSVRSRRSKL